MFNRQKVEVMFKKILITSLLLIYISACVYEKTAPDSLSAPTQTFSAASPIFQFTSTPNVTRTSTPSNEAKISQATIQAFDELINVFPGACEGLSKLDVLFSPDGNWLAGECNYNSSFQIINTDGSTTINITHKELFGEYQGSIKPIHWTNDSQFLYFSADTCCWDPLFQLLSDTTNLYKLDIVDGHYDLFRKGLFDLSFSPTGKHITFIEELETPLIVEIQDTRTEISNSLVLEVGNTYNQAQIGVWSRDGSKFVVKAVSGINYDNTTFDPDQFSLILVDINNLSQKIIFKDFQTTTLKILDWTKDNILIFQTGGGYNTEPVVTWQYLLKTDTLTTPTPTSDP